MLGVQLGACLGRCLVRVVVGARYCLVSLFVFCVVGEVCCGVY